MISEDKGSGDDGEHSKNGETDSAETEYNKISTPRPETEGVLEITHNKIVTGRYLKRGQAT